MYRSMHIAMHFCEQISQLIKMTNISLNKNQLHRHVISELIKIHTARKK